MTEMRSRFIRKEVCARGRMKYVWCVMDMSGDQLCIVIDRIVCIGKTMGFDLVWDGYNPYDMITRVVIVS